MALIDSSLAAVDGDDRQVIRCLYCATPQQISRRAITINCKFCNKTLRIEPVTIKDYQARRSIETCGALTIDRKGNVFSDQILCGSLVVRGRLRANVVSQGPVLVGPEAQVRGNVTAPTLAVGEGAVLDGEYRIGAMERCED
jgi:Polymer-forming cytoskeletal